jgi:hypothetical protein
LSPLALRDLAPIVARWISPEIKARFFARRYGRVGTFARVVGDEAWTAEALAPVFACFVRFDQTPFLTQRFLVTR